MEVVKIEVKEVKVPVEVKKYQIVDKINEVVIEKPTVKYVI